MSRKLLKPDIDNKNVSINPYYNINRGADY